MPKNKLSLPIKPADSQDNSAPSEPVALLWSFRDGALLCLVGDERQILDWATVRYSFASPGELVFAAHYVPLVRTLAGDTVEGIAFAGLDGQKEFDRLRRLRASGAQGDVVGGKGIEGEGRAGETARRS